MVRLPIRSRSLDAATSRHPGSLTLAAVAVVTSLLLAGCSSAARETLNQVTGTARSSGGAAVAPSGEKVAVDGSSSTSPAGVPGAAPSTALPTVGDARQIIRTGTADLEVRSVVEAFETVRQIATGAGGNVTESSFVGSGDQQSAQLTLRVPSARFSEVLTRLRDVAVEVRSITTGSSDVTDEVTDVEATLRNLRAVEAQYTQLLSRAGSITDVLAVQDRLNQTRLQIDRTEARRQSLASRTEMSTITVSLRPVGGPALGRGGALGAVQAAWAASLSTLQGIAIAVLVAVVYLWWAIPVGIVALLIARRAQRRRAGAAVETAPPSAP